MKEFKRKFLSVFLVIAMMMSYITVFAGEEDMNTKTEDITSTNENEVIIDADKTAQWTSREAGQNYSLRVHGWHEWENAAYIGFTLPDDLEFDDILEVLLTVNTTAYKGSGEGYIYSAEYSAFENAVQYEGGDNVPLYNQTEFKSFTTPSRMGNFTLDITDYIKTMHDQGKNIAFRLDVKSLDTNNAWGFGSCTNGTVPKLTVRKNGYIAPTLAPMPEVTPVPTPTEKPSAVYEKPSELKTENMRNPICIDSKNPKFSWKYLSSDNGVTQTAYRIIVSSDEEKLNNDVGDMWDSGKVISDKQYAVKYNGLTLESTTKYYWKVQVYNNDSDNASDWSENASFETALLNQSDFKAKLVGGNGIKIVRNEIIVPEDKIIAYARAYVSSPGYFEMHINGNVIGNHITDPVQTNPAVRLLYPVFDVTEDLHNGENAVGAMLGYGGITSASNDSKNRYFFMQLEVKYTDGTTDTFITDESWKCSANSPITFDDPYYGETYDANLEIDGWDCTDFDDSSWNTVAVKDIGNIIMTAQKTPVKAIETIVPTAVTSPSEGVFVFDLGKNISGRPYITVSGTPGMSVSMRCAEILNSDGNINVNTTNKEWKCIYTLKGYCVETYAPRFAIGGFRYIEITGLPNDVNIENLSDYINVTAQFVTSDSEVTGSFVSSDIMLNSIHDMYVLSQKANLSSGIPIDCPHRERLGWLGDAILIADAVNYNFDASNLLTKWFDDMDDELEKTGLWQTIIPHPSAWVQEKFDAMWLSGNIIIPYEVYRAYGDADVLEKNYPRMSKLMEYFEDNSDSYLITNESGWGDWVSAMAYDNTDMLYIHSCVYYHCADLMTQIAKTLGKTEDKEKYGLLAKNIKNAVNEKWLNDDGSYNTGTQTANAMALSYGIVTEDKESFTLQALKEQIEQYNYRFTTGIPGIYCLFDALIKYDETETAYRLLMQEAYPSFGFMIKNGATTPWEKWFYGTGKMDSWNHAFLIGPAESWLNHAAAGITAAEAGYKEIEIKPAIVGDVTNVKGSYDSVYGTIISEWERSDESLAMNVSVPSNTTAYIYVPTLGADAAETVIKQNGIVIWQCGEIHEMPNEIEYIKTEKNYIVFKVISGEYHFEMSANENITPMKAYLPDDNDGVKIGASAFSSQSNVTVRGTTIGGLQPISYVCYNDINLDRVDGIQVEFADSLGKNLRIIDFRTDSADGEIFATLYAVGTAEKNSYNYHIQSCDAVRVGGTHNVYLTFRGSDWIGNIASVKFINGSDSETVASERREIYALKDEDIQLPTSVYVYCADKSVQKRYVKWDNADTSVAGVYKINGTVSGLDIPAVITLNVVGEKEDGITVKNITEDVHLGDEAKVAVRIINNTDNSIGADFIVGLFDENENLIQTKILSDISAKAYSQNEVSVKIKIPDTGNYTIKYFLWENRENIKPIIKNESIVVK